MPKICSQCTAPFEITPEDIEFYERMSPVFLGKKYVLPAPSLCPDCRQQRRLSYRNERYLHHRKCHKTGKQVISTYSAEKPYIIYDQDEWWSDSWNPLDYGRDFDFSRPFFEQFHELSLEVPRPCILNMSSENSAYTNHSSYNKNCYMCINTGYSEDCYYCSNFNIYNTDCVDCLAIQHCEQCYSCVDCKKLYACFFLEQCENSRDCAFCYDCKGCQNCFGCWNLRNKQYCILNKQYTEQEYRAKMAEMDMGSFGAVSKFREYFRTQQEQQAIHKYIMMYSCENCSGGHVVKCKNVQHSYCIFESEDCSYCYDCGELKNARDATEPFKGEWHHETHACNLGNNFLCCSKSYEGSHNSYCQYCWYCTDIFGCFAVRRKQYCILNKQYTKEEYEELVPKIIAHMQQTGEWGEFFPVHLSSYGYNETAAHEYYPLSKQEVISRNWKWHEEEQKGEKYLGPQYEIPDHISQAGESICAEILRCVVTGKPYKIIPQELEFYQEMKLPIPRKCPDQRHKERMALRNPRQLWQRTCDNCSKHILSSYAPERNETVYCEECYLSVVR